MLKRILGILLCSTVVLIPSCTSGERRREGDHALYFLRSSYEDSAGSGALAAEWVALEAGDTQSQARQLVERLLAGPTQEGFKRTIPSGTNLLSLELQGRRAVVDLSAAYGSLSGIALTLADYAITLTLTQLPDIQAVEITVRGNRLVYRDQQIFTGRDVVLDSEEDVVGTVAVRLYFLTESGELAPQSRELQLYEGDTQVGAVAAALTDGPEGKKLLAVFPENLRVRSAWQEEEVCYVNLSSALLEELTEVKRADLEKALTAIGRSMCSLETVTETRFLVDGEFMEEYGGVDISVPYH